MEVIKYIKGDTRVFYSYHFCLISLLCSKYFLSIVCAIAHNWPQFSLNFNPLVLFISLNPSSNLLKEIKISLAAGKLHFNSFVQAAFRMFDLGQKLVLDRNHI